MLSVLVHGAGRRPPRDRAHRRPPRGALDTDLDDVTVSTPTKPTPEAEPPPPEPADDKRCWRTFGGDPQRSLARTSATLGLPERKPVMDRGLRSYIEFPPTYCEGDLYVNTFEGATYSIEAETGKVHWRRRVGGTLPSSPAIDGPRVIVALAERAPSPRSTARRDASSGRCRRAARSSPRPSSSTASSTSAPTTAGSSRSAPNGHVRWAYDTGGRVNASPSVFGGRVCVGTYAGSIVCLDKDTGRELWTTYSRRDAFRYDSFYASASTDGQRLYSVARSGTRGRARRRDRRHRLDRPRRRPRLHDARGRGRPRLRRRVRRPPARAPRPQTAPRSGASGSAAGSSARRSSSATTSSSRPSRRRRTRCASRTARSPGGCRWAATRPASPPSGRTSSRSTAALSLSAAATRRSARVVETRGWRRRQSGDR